MKLGIKQGIAMAAIIGIVAVPSAVFASRSNDDSVQHMTSAKHDDQHQVKQEDRQAANVDTETTATSSSEQEHEHGQTTPVANTPAATVSEDQARTIAQNQMPGKTILKVEHETEESVTVFSVRFDDGSQVDVDANSGNVVRDDDNDMHADNGTNSMPMNGSMDMSMNNGSTHDEHANSSDHSNRGSDSSRSNRGSDHTED